MKILFIIDIKNAARAALVEKRERRRRVVELIKDNKMYAYTFNYSITLARISLLKAKTRYLTFC